MSEADIKKTRFCGRLLTLPSHSQSRAVLRSDRFFDDTWLQPCNALFATRDTSTTSAPRKLELAYFLSRADEILDTTWPEERCRRLLLTVWVFSQGWPPITVRNGKEQTGPSSRGNARLFRDAIFTAAYNLVPLYRHTYLELYHQTTTIPFPHGHGYPKRSTASRHAVL